MYYITYSLFLIKDNLWLWVAFNIELNFGTRSIRYAITHHNAIYEYDRYI